MFKKCARASTHARSRSIRRFKQSIHYLISLYFYKNNFFVRHKFTLKRILPIVPGFHNFFSFRLFLFFFLNFFFYFIYSFLTFFFCFYSILMFLSFSFSSLSFSVLSRFFLSLFWHILFTSLFFLFCYSFIPVVSLFYSSTFSSYLYFPVFLLFSLSRNSLSFSLSKRIHIHKGTATFILVI